MTEHISIAIDGPSGAGKTTIAKKLAQMLEFVYVDTGAMYRGIGVRTAKLGIDMDDEAAISAAVEDISMDIRYEGGEQHVYVNDEDVTSLLRTEEISKRASVTSQYKAVRAKLLSLQRELAKNNDVVMDGRDIGTVVLPDAQLKIFLTAKPEVQAQRRYDQLAAKGALNGATYESILADIKERDYRDSHRENAPLVQADDAVKVDSSEMTIEEVIGTILTELDKRRA